MKLYPPEPKPLYDAVVIGSGLAGLTAAAFLCQGGARVLVCGQNNLVGGLFNSFWRGDYLFDGGIKAVENSAVMMPMLAQLGLLDQVKLRRSPIALILNGCVQPVRGFADVEAYLHTLGELFPTEQAGLPKQYRAVYLSTSLTGDVQTADLPGLLAGEDFGMNGMTVVEAAARGRKAAFAVWAYL